MWELWSPKGLGVFGCICAVHMTSVRHVRVHEGCAIGALYCLMNLKPALQASGLSEREEEEGMSLGSLPGWALLEGTSPANLAQACPE